MITLGKLIEQSRLSNSKIAKYCGVSYSTAYKWSKGLRRPKPEHLIRLSKILHVKMIDLYEIIYGGKNV